MRSIVPLLVIISLLGCTEPLSDDLLDFVGIWTSDQTRLTITEGGEFAYASTTANRQASVALPIVSISDSEIVVGGLFGKSRFQIDGRPSSRDGFLSLIVDGEVLMKMNRAGTGPVVSEVPTTEEIEAITRRDILALHQAVTNLDFDEYWNTLSRVAQTQISPDGLLNNYQSAIDGGLDLGYWLAGAYLNRIPAAVDQDGMLLIQGAFLKPGGQYLGVEGHYLAEQGEWLALVPKLFISSYEVRKPPTPEAATEDTNEATGTN